MREIEHPHTRASLGICRAVTTLPLSSRTTMKRRSRWRPDEVTRAEDWATPRQDLIG